MFCLIIPAVRFAIRHGVCCCRDEQILHQRRSCFTTVKLITLIVFGECLVCVKWRLHFEFVTSTKTSGERLDETKEGTCWTGPENIDIETMVWDLPIQIYPPVPSIANDPHAQTRITIAI